MFYVLLIVLYVLYLYICKYVLEDHMVDLLMQLHVQSSLNNV